MDLPKHQHQIAFVSGQVLPILLGVSLPGREPEGLHLVITSQMHTQKKRLQGVLKDKIKEITTHNLIKSTHQEDIQTVLDDICGQYGAENLSLNVTGGTKLMALAASEWAFINDIPVFYVDTSQDELLLLGQKWEYEPLPSLLDVKGILNSHGYAIASSIEESVAKERRDILSNLLDLACQVPDALSRLNDLAQKAELPPHTVNDQGSDSPVFEEMLSLCKAAGMLQTRNSDIYFASDEARKWCGGLWLEEYVRSVLCKLKRDKTIHSWAGAVAVNQGQVPNELDALFTARNRLFTIECKTSDMRKDKLIKKAPAAIYKADSLRNQLGGIFTGTMICSVIPLASHDLKRAQKRNIKIVSGEDVRLLADKLKEWIKSAD